MTRSDLDTLAPSASPPSFELFSAGVGVAVDKMPGALGKLFETVLRPPSSAPDQLTDSEASGTAKGEKQTTMIHDITQTLLTPKNALTVAQGISTIASGQPMNDRELLLEHSVSMLQSLPPNSSMGLKLGNALIGALWKDLPHPPGTVCGPRPVYRSGDGSGNNLWNPEMGKAGSPYSRSVPPMKTKPPALPDPELIYNELLRRDEREFREHPSGLNRMFFSFATVVIHECFQSKHEKPWINETSSYVDLSTVYGNNQTEQNTVRTFENGKLYPDTIASSKIMLMPPNVVAVCLLFARMHNHVAERLLEINERGDYQPIAEASVDELKAQDEDIFQKARNITVAHFATTVLHDYVSAILNTVRANSEWHLELGSEIQQMGGNRLERGTGNVVSAEFNVLYRWHAALSASDDWWMQDVLKTAIPDKEIDKLTDKEVWGWIRGRIDELNSQPPNEWTFGGLERDENGKFDDVQLANLFKDIIEEPAHAFGARSTPTSLRLIEIAGMKMAREAFNVCTLNEFRKYLSLTEYKSFLEWNPDPEIAAAAEKLYGHVDNLELYPGLIAEETKPSMPGSGVCPGHTTGRGILDDAVSLVRGDRFLTFDLNSSTLTNWGMSQLQPAPGAYGGILPKMLFTALPDAWTGTSAYVLLPFYTPKAVKKILTDNKVVKNYKLERPGDDLSIKSITSYRGCKKAFEDRELLETFYHDRICAFDPKAHFVLCSDNKQWHDERDRLLKDALYPDTFESDVRAYFNKTMPELIRQNSTAYRASDRRQIDIVRDVCNVAPITWLAERFAIPLKTPEHPRGLVSVPELFAGLLVLFMYTSFDIVPHAEWQLREAATSAGKMLHDLLRAQIRAHTTRIEPVVDWISRNTAYKCGPDAERLFTAMKKTKLPLDTIAWNLLHIMAAAAGNITQQASLLIDFYLRDDRATERERIVELAHSTGAAVDDELLGYVYEGMRLAGVVPGLPRRATRDFVFDNGGREVPLKRGDTVLLAISQASLDADAFPEPFKVNPRRPRDKYILLGWGLHYCFGERLVKPSLVSMLRQVFRLKNLRRADGKAGELVSVSDSVGGVPTKLYLDRNSAESPVPTTMVVEYDEEVALVPAGESTRKSYYVS